MALESICTLLGENATDWKAIRGVIIRDNFISTIVNFDADDISDYVREQMKVIYFFSNFLLKNVKITDLFVIFLEELKEMSAKPSRKWIVAPKIWF